MKKITTFGSRLKEALLISNTDMPSLSNRTKIAPSLLYRYEKDLVTPRNDKIDIIADALNVNRAWLLGFDCSSEIITKEKNDCRNNINILLNKLSLEELKRVEIILTTIFDNKQ